MLRVLVNKQTTRKNRWAMWVGRWKFREDQREMLEIQSTVTEIKNDFDGFIGGLDSVKERISELEECLRRNLQNWKQREFFYLVEMFNTLSPGDRFPVALKKNCAKEAGGKVRLYTSLQQREQSVWISKIRYQVKEFSILSMGRCKPLGLLKSFLSYVPQLSEANTVSLDPLNHSFRSSHSLKARNCWWLWHFLFIDMAGDIFIS